MARDRYILCIMYSMELYGERWGGAVFGEWGWIAIVVPHGHSRLRTSFLEMKFRKSSEVALYACCPCGDVFTLSATVPEARSGVQ